MGFVSGGIVLFVVALAEVFVVDVWMLLVVLDTALGSSGAVLSVLLREAGPVLLDTSLIVMLSSLLGCSS